MKDSGRKPGRKDSEKPGKAGRDDRSKRDRKLRDSLGNPFLWLVPFLLVVVLGWAVFSSMFGYRTIDTSDGLALLRDKADTIESVTVIDGTQRVELDLSTTYVQPKKKGDSEARPLGKKVEFSYTDAQAEQVDRLVQAAAPKDGYNSVVPTTTWWSSLIQLLVPAILLGGFMWWLLSRMGGGRGGAMGFGRSKAKVGSKEMPDVTFDDVAGEDEAVEELEEIREFLSEPDKFRAVGAKIPKGVLLYGPPGTGKTLLAKAVAGEAGVPFFVEMDGFDANTNVILIAATNRPDVLDPALLRPGRFDRQVSVEAPDMAGRAAILRVHAKGKPLTDDVDLDLVAKRTPGFTGADLANVLNEAALLTARSNAHLIDNRALDEAIDRVIAGPQKRTRVMRDHEKRVTAYHEAGHALCAAAGAYSDPVTKVTILPRGRALGYTQVMPQDDKYSTTRNELLDQLVYAMGGRAAEEIIFRDPTTGASNDIEKATATARKMVTDYGMTSAVGAVKLGTTENETVLGLNATNRDFSEQVAATVDAEVRSLLDTAHREAWEILTRNRAVLDELAEELLTRETLLEKDLERIFADVVKQSERPLWRSDETLPVVEVSPATVAAADGESGAGRSGDDFWGYHQ